MSFNKDDKSTSDTSQNIGCFGAVLFGIGIIFLFPLITWIEYIFVNLMYLGIAIFIVGVVFYLIYSAIKKNI